VLLCYSVVGSLLHLDVRGGAVVLVVPGRDGLRVRLEPDGMVVQRLVEVDTRAHRHSVRREAIRNVAEAALLVDDRGVGLLDEVLKIRPGEAKRPEELVEPQVARRGDARVLELLHEALAIRGKTLAEERELARLSLVRDDIELGREDKILGGLAARRNGEDHCVPFYSVVDG
jgi:hypothetical protein